MGDIADMMLDGTLCEQCGCLMEDLIQPDTDSLKDPPGYPRICDDCWDEADPKIKALFKGARQADGKLSLDL